MILLGAAPASAAGKRNFLLHERRHSCRRRQRHRMGAGVDKLFLEVAGRPVVVHTWQRFDGAECIGEIILVVRKGMQRPSPSWRKHINFKNPFASSPAARSVKTRFGMGCRRFRLRLNRGDSRRARPCTNGELIAATVRAADESARRWRRNR